MKDQPSVSDNGYVSIHRKIENSWLWHEKPFSKGQAWIDLIMLANYTPHKKPKGGKVISYRRGDVNKSMLFLADRWGWDRKTVKRFLEVLESDGMVTIERSTQGTTITLVNYDFYQGRGTTNRPTHGTAYGTTHGTTYGTTHGTQTIKNNKDNKGNKDNKSVCVVPPTLEQIRAYCADHGYTHVNVEKFYSLYASRNWMDGGRMMNWQQRLAYWESQDREKAAPKKTGFSNFRERKNDTKSIEAQLMKKRWEETDGKD